MPAEIRIVAPINSEVLLNKDSKGFITNDEYKLSNLKPAKYLVEIVKKGFLTQSYELELKDNTIARLIFEEFQEEMEIEQVGDLLEPVTMNLIKSSSTLKIISKPARCKVVFRGRKFDKTKNELIFRKVPLGKYIVIFITDEFTVEKEVSVIDTNINLLDINLKVELDKKNNTPEDALEPINATNQENIKEEIKPVIEQKIEEKTPEIITKKVYTQAVIEKEKPKTETTVNVKSKPKDKDIVEEKENLAKQQEEKIIKKEEVAKETKVVEEEKPKHTFKEVKKHKPNIKDDIKKTIEEIKKQEALKEKLPKTETKKIAKFAPAKISFINYPHSYIKKYKNHTDYLEIKLVIINIDSKKEVFTQKLTKTNKIPPVLISKGNYEISAFTSIKTVYDNQNPSITTNRISNTLNSVNPGEQIKVMFDINDFGSPTEIIIANR